MRGPARLATGAALLLALLALQQAAPAGLPALVGAAACLLLGTPERRPQRRGAGWGAARGGLRDLREVLAVVIAGSVSVATLLHVALTPSPPAAVAWLPRTLGLWAAALLVRTPPAALPLHALAVLLALWTAAALVPRAAPGESVLAPAVLALVATAAGLQLARRLELEQAAGSSVTVGVAPTPWGVRPRRLPPLVLVALAAAPLALGVELPRLRRGETPAAATTAPAAARDGATAGSPTRVVGFEPDVRFERSRAALAASDRPVARAWLPGVEQLLLRGAVLEQADAGGFGPAAAEAPGEALQQELGAGEVRAVEVELLEPVDGLLLTVGPLRALRGTAWIPSPAGPRAPPGAAYPLRYVAECLLPPAQPRDDPPPLERPDLLRVPDAVAQDPDLRALAQEVAWGRSPIARARHAAAWLMASCRYDARQPLRQTGLRGRLREFLLVERRGVCVEFAASLATLLRLQGVPARLVSGFRCELRDAEGWFVVRARDAHAWVEVGVVGAGWVPFDPTPPSPAEAGPPVRPEAGPSDAGPLEAAAPAPRPVTPLVVGALAVLLLASLGSWRTRRAVTAAHLARDRVSAPELADARARLFAALVRRGFRLDGAETPLELVARRRAAGLAEPALEEAVARYTRLRFSGRTDQDDRQALRRSLEQLRG